MFGQDPDPRGDRPAFLSYCFHLFFGFLPALLLGFIAEVILDPFYARDGIMATLAPGGAVIALIVGFSFNSVRRDSCALFIFLPPALVFLVGWHALAANWSPTWSHESRNEYVVNNLFGPLSKCGGTECLDTLPTTILLSGLCYSLGALVGLLIRGRRQPEN